MKRYLQNTGQVFFDVIFYTFFLFIVTACGHRQQVNQQLQQVNHLLWENLDSCTIVLKNIDTTTLSDDQKQVWNLKQAHLNMRLQHDLYSAENILRLAEYFSQHKDYAYAGEAYYLVGSTYIIQNEAIQATRWLKEAEWHLLRCPNMNDNLLGIIYYRLGDAAEKERVFDTAHEYYRQSISHLKRAKNNLFLCCAYRDAGKTMQDEHIDLALQYCDTALFYAQLGNYTALQKEIEYIIETIRKPNGFTPHLLSLSRYLSDTLGINNYSEKLIEYHLAKQQSDSAYLYMEKLLLDTAYNIWSKEHYYYYLASYLSMTQQKDSAITVLQQLHTWQTKEIENTAMARTYTIAQQYDLVKEEEKIMLLKLERMRWIILSLALTLAAMIIGTLAVRIHHINTKRLQKQQKLYNQLQKQDKEKNERLRTQIYEILNDAKKININNRLHTTSFAMQMEQIRSDFELTHNHLLDRLSQQYQLTETDLDVILCSALDLDIADISIILNKSKDTLYRRRQRLKHHLQLDASANLDEWIKTQLEA